MTESPYLPFSQRTGLAPVPPQLKLGEASSELRRLLHYALHQEIQRVKSHGPSGSYFDEKWKPVALDFHVRMLRQAPDQFKNSAYDFGQELKRITLQVKYGDLFDVVEFFARHASCSATFKQDLASAFVDSRAAYRLIEGEVRALGSAEQAETFVKAIDQADAKGAVGARRHLLAASTELRAGSWAGSVRESINAVESVAVRLAPKTSTLGDALKVIDKAGHLHGQLKSAFEKLYAYTNGEEGVRHAVVFSDEAQVDEADALFMLGACASFVSYLLARSP